MASTSSAVTAFREFAMVNRIISWSAVSHASPIMFSELCVVVRRGAAIFRNLVICSPSTIRGVCAPGRAAHKFKRASKSHRGKTNTDKKSTDHFKGRVEYQIVKKRDK
jgi:hypothetical protein